MPLFPFLFWLFLGVIVVQISYYLVFLFAYVWQPVIRHKKSPSLPLSVIVCAKNEAKNLRNNIPILLEQNYPSFELVLVNDNSSDDSLEIMEGFAKRYANIKVVNVKHVESFWGNKKYALTLGIKAASKPFLVFTDADCKPRSNNWLQHVSNAFSKEKPIVLGYGAYKLVKASFLNRLIRFETLLTAIQYFSYSNLGLTYMGVGRNLGYHRDVFFENAGYMQHMNVISGDDDLFINNVATKTNVALIDHHESVTESLPKQKFADWFRQKRRHVSTSGHYKSLHKLLLGGFYVSQFSFIALSLILLISLYQWPVVLGLVIGRYLLVGSVYYLSLKKLREKGLIYIAPLLELILIVVQFFIFSFNIISKPKHWN